MSDRTYWMAILIVSGALIALTVIGIVYGLHPHPVQVQPGVVVTP